MNSRAAAIAIIDDDAAFRKSLARLVRANQYEALEFSCAEEFIAAPERARIDCAIVDVQMPGLSGLELQRQSSASLPHLGMVFLTGAAGIPESVRAIQDGAVDFLEKPVEETSLLRALAAAVERTRAARAIAIEAARLQQRYEALTPREREVFALVAAGLLNKQVAIKLGTSERTIKAHRRQVMEKLGADSLAHLVRMADRLGVKRLDAQEWNELSGRGAAGSSSGKALELRER